MFLPGHNCKIGVFSNFLSVESQCEKIFVIIRDKMQICILCRASSDREDSRELLFIIPFNEVKFTVIQLKLLDIFYFTHIK